MSTDAARQVLKQIPGWDTTAEIDVRHIGSGNTNTSWIIERDGTSFVLRVDSPSAKKLSLNRANELLVRTYVSRAGLAPAVIHSNPELGILLSEYVSGRTWRREDLLREENLLELALTLRRLYALPAVGATFDPGQALKRYAHQLQDDVSRDRTREALNILKTVRTRPSVLCHNDLVAENIVSGEQLWLIDWEYAGVGDPLFDLAVVVEHHGIEKEPALIFVESSLGSMNRTIAEDLRSYCKVYRHLVALWSEIV